MEKELSILIQSKQMYHLNIAKCFYCSPTLKHFLCALEIDAPSQNSVIPQTAIFLCLVKYNLSSMLYHSEIPSYQHLYSLGKKE